MSDVPDPQTVANLREALKGRLPLAYGVSGALATPLYADRDVTRLIEVAREAGISIFDTGPSYGAGRAETRLGKAVGNDPDAFIMTKAGLSSAGLLKRIRNFAPDAIKQSVHGSLRRLKRERIDLLWMHGPGKGELSDELFRALEDLARDGKVSSFGVALRDEAILLRVTAGPFAAFMAPANPMIAPPNKANTDLVFFGIECLAGVRAQIGGRWNRNRLWTGAKSLIRGVPETPAPRSAEEAFAYAFQTAGCDFVVSSSTQAARIHENAAICAKL